MAVVVRISVAEDGEAAEVDLVEAAAPVVAGLVDLAVEVLGAEEREEAGRGRGTGDQGLGIRNRDEGLGTFA